MPANSLLFQPGRMGTLELKNRLLLSPMSTLFAEDDGSFGDTLIDWYRRRAEGGVGMVVVEAAQVGTSVDVFKIWSNALRVDDDRFIPPAITPS